MSIFGEMIQHGDRRGVWVIYTLNPSPEAKSIHVDPARALEAHEYGDLMAFWPIDMSLTEAIQLWGQRHQE